MTGNEYQKLAMRTRNRDLNWNEQTFNSCLGLSGEVGEYNDLVKKVFFQNHEISYEDLKKELGDILWYVALACEVWNFNFDDVMELNIDKLKRRYPEGFDGNLSINRREDDV